MKQFLPAAVAVIALLLLTTAAVAQPLDNYDVNDNQGSRIGGASFTGTTYAAAIIGSGVFTGTRVSWNAGTKTATFAPTGSTSEEDYWYAWWSVELGMWIVLNPPWDRGHVGSLTAI